MRALAYLSLELVSIETVNNKAAAFGGEELLLSTDDRNNR
jgi:hypothetical protein